MTTTVHKTAGAGRSFVVPNAAIAAIPIFTRKGFHSYFAKRLAGFACDDQAFIDWRGLRLPCRLTRGQHVVRAAFPVTQL